MAAANVVVTKAAVEREQSDACIDSAEREQARPKVKGRRKKAAVQTSWT